MSSWFLILINHAVSIAVREIYAMFPRISHSIIRHEASRLPEEIRGRYLEEWLAESDSYVGSGRQVSRALSLVMFGTAIQMTREFDAGQFEDLDEQVRTELSKVAQLLRDNMLTGERFERARTVEEAKLSQSVELLESTIRGAIDNATARGQTEIAEKLVATCAVAKKLAQTVLRALALIREYIDAEGALIRRVALIQQATLLAAAGKLDHVHRALRSAVVDRPSVIAVFLEVRAQLNEINQMDLNALDPTRANRQAHCARMQAALTEMTRSRHGNPASNPQIA